MTCGSCGVRNVDFASTCFACRRPLGKLAAPTPAAPVREAFAARTRAPRGATSGTSTPSVPRGAALRLLLLAAVAWVLVRGLPLRVRLISPHSAEGPTEPANKAEPLPPEPAAEEPVARALEEQNGFRLVHFEWGVPATRPGGRFRTGDTVTGRSEIQGFGVTADRKIDVTVALAFRDPMGNLVEPVSPKTLRQPMQSETLFTNFDYAISPDAPGGEYDLEIAVDDAVSARSARFHRKIAVEVGMSQ
jgi:hypothetical protein